MLICLQCSCLLCFDAIRPVKELSGGVLAWVVICLEQGAGLHMAQLMPLPLTVSCFSKIQIGLTFLVPAHPGNPGQRAVKLMCVCACVRACVCACVRVCARVCVCKIHTLLYVQLLIVKLGLKWQ